MNTLDRAASVEIGTEGWMDEGGPISVIEPAVFEPPPPSSRVRPAVRREIVEARPARFLLELLAGVERRAGAHSIAFDAPDGRRVGEVLTIDGQIGLVALAEGQIPLGVRLRDRNPGAALDVQRALKRARAEGRPIGSVLLEIGGVGAAEIRAAMLDQIADGLAEIARAAPGGLLELLAPLSARRATSLLSAFAPAEAYWHAVRQLEPPLDDKAACCFRELAPQAGAAVLAARRSGDDAWLPVATAALAPLSLAEVEQLGQALAQIAQPPALSAAGITPELVVFRAESESVVCVCSGRQVAVLGGLDAMASVRVLGQACRMLAQLDADV